MLSWRSPRFRWLLVALCVLPLRAAHGQAAWVLQPNSRLWIDGTSNVRAFSCEASQVTMVVADGSHAMAVAAPAQPSMRTALVTVPDAALDCGNPFMNIHMRRALKASIYPAIVFSVAAAELTHGLGDSPAPLTGALTLGGVTRPVQVLATGTEGPSEVHVLGRSRVLMSDFGLTPPALFFGRVRVADSVAVRFDLTLRGGATPGQP